MYTTYKVTHPSCSTSTTSSTHTNIDPVTDIDIDNANNIGHYCDSDLMVRLYLPLRGVRDAIPIATNTRGGVDGVLLLLLLLLLRAPSRHGGRSDSRAYANTARGSCKRTDKAGLGPPKRRLREVSKAGQTWSQCSRV